MLKMLAKLARKKAPLIFATIAAGGSVAIGILSAKATIKACDILQEHEDENLTTSEKVKLVAHCYIPTVSVTLGVVGSIFGAYFLSTHQVKAMASAYTALLADYSALKSTLTSYRHKVVEVIGEEEEGDIYKEAVKESLNPGSEHDILFYEEYSDRFFEMPLDKVKDAEYMVNRIFGLRGYVSLAEYHECLGLASEYAEEETGWSWEDAVRRGYEYEIEFEHDVCYTDQGRECHVIRFNVDPSSSYLD